MSKKPISDEHAKQIRIMVQNAYEARGWIQQDLADASGFSRFDVSRVLTGQRALALEHVIGFSYVLLLNYKFPYTVGCHTFEMDTRSLCNNWGQSIYSSGEQRGLSSDLKVHWDATKQPADDYLSGVEPIFRPHPCEMTFSEWPFTRLLTVIAQLVTFTPIVGAMTSRKYADIGKGMDQFSSGPGWPNMQGPPIINMVPQTNFTKLVEIPDEKIPPDYRDEWKVGKAVWLKHMKTKLESGNYGLHLLTKKTLSKVWHSMSNVDPDNMEPETGLYPTLAVVGDKYAIRRDRITSEILVIEGGALVEGFYDDLTRLKKLAIKEEDRCPELRALNQIDALLARSEEGQNKKRVFALSRQLKPFKHSVGQR
jgi:hypothetical protein